MLRLVQRSRGSSLTIELRNRRTAFSRLLVLCMTGSVMLHAAGLLFSFEKDTVCHDCQKSAVRTFPPLLGEPQVKQPLQNPLPYPEWLLQ